jgi:hypothetical protein
VTAPGGQDIAPGGSQKVVVNISTRYFKDTVLKNIEIQTDDPQTPLVTLVMKAKIVEILTVFPMEIDFGSVKTGSLSKHTITIMNKGKEPLILNKINGVPAGVVSVSQQGGEIKLDPGKVLSLELRFQPSQPDEYFFGWVNITASPENLQKSVRIKARVVKE